MSHAKRIPLPHLVAKWERIVREVEAGQLLTRDDYLNDLDLRHQIARRSREHAFDRRHGLDVNATARLDALDARFRAVTVDGAECVWGERNAREHGWTPAREWYYYRVPRVKPAAW